MAEATLSSAAIDQSLANIHRDFPIHGRSGKNLITHYFGQSFKWAIYLLFAGAVIYLIELAIGIVHTPYGMAKNPAHLVVRCLGFAHYTVATYFLLTSKRIRNVRGVLTLLLFIGISIGLCYLLYMMGGYKNRVAMLSASLFFLIHALRDEIFFYRQRSGKAIGKEEYPLVYRYLAWAQAMGLAAVSAILYPIYLYGVFHIKGHPQVAYYVDDMLPGFSVLARALIVAAPFAVVALGIAAWLHHRYPGGLLKMFQSHHPVSYILGVYLGVALFSFVAGPSAIYILILVHFTGWFVFACWTIRQQPRDARRAIGWKTPNKWIKQSLTGFWVFHGGLILLFLALISVNHYVFGQSTMRVGGTEMENPLTLLFSMNAFFYWTIIHITLGFMPKPKLPAKA